jgi:holo-[acyl-carrier protein] synthase
MSIKGVGIDLIELARFKKALDRQGFAFVERILTQREIEYCKKFSDPLPHFAVRFAAKEAIVKALGTGFRDEITFQEIEIINDHYGRPECILSSKLCKKFSDAVILVSLTHTKSLAQAIAILKQ